MKILIVQDYLRIGGTERQALFLARFFKEHGHDTRLLVFRPGGHLADEALKQGIPVLTLQSFDSGLPLWAPRLMRSIKNAAPDIVLCMGRTANCYAGFIQKRFPSIHVVCTLRTGKMIFPLHHWSLGVVRSVLVNSNWWKRRMLERNFPESRIHVVHNSVLLERSETEKQNLRRQYRQDFGIDEETTLFLNVATFRPGKRHIDLLKIFRDLRENHPDAKWRLWLVGDGKLYRRCRHWAAENGLGTRVRFFHFQKDTLPFYAAADIGVSTSREDSLSNFIIEAQASGLPIVAYDCRGVAECCQHNETGVIVPPKAPDQFQKHLLEYMNNSELKNQHAANAPAFAESHFSAIPQAKAILDFLESLTDD